MGDMHRINEMVARLGSWVKSNCSANSMQFKPINSRERNMGYGGTSGVWVDEICAGRIQPKWSRAEMVMDPRFGQSIVFRMLLR